MNLIDNGYGIANKTVRDEARLRTVSNTQSVHLFVLEECGSGECPTSFIFTQISHDC